MTGLRSTVVSVPTTDGTADAYFVAPDDDSTRPGVLLYMDAFGLRPQLESMADRLAGEGYAVLVPNVFYRRGAAPLVELPAFIGGDGRAGLFDQLKPLMADLTNEAVIRDAEAFVDWLSARPEVGDTIGATGYCMGARLALLTAAYHPDHVTAAAGFHGARLGSEAPDSPHLFVEAMTAELYLGHADGDPSMPPEQIERLDEALDAAGVRHTTEVYDGAQHGYTMADTDRYDASADARHWAALVDLFARNL
ncbi:dienelactone hydrolase family protein [Nocardioides sp. MH1]|uniref:dienelactone hydrolase family protein n=1 Tax=Nocardioides sp. MH1 TaxID=3242490 RepID=UPI003521FAB1